MHEPAEHQRTALDPNAKTAAPGRHDRTPAHIEAGPIRAPGPAVPTTKHRRLHAPPERERLTTAAGLPIARSRECWPTAPLDPGPTAHQPRIAPRANSKPAHTRLPTTDCLARLNGALRVLHFPSFRPKGSPYVATPPYRSRSCSACADWPARMRVFMASCAVSVISCHLGLIRSCSGQSARAERRRRIREGGTTSTRTRRPH